MAATVSSVWAKPGAWALDSEEHEDELKREIESQKSHQFPEPPAADFPSLAAAAAAKSKKKNKGQTLSLAEFSNYGSAKPVSSGPQRLTQDELLMLPTGPRQRTAEELDRSRLGGGFRNYGGGMGDSSRVRDFDRNREGYNGNSNREIDLGPSRADEVDDWSKTKKFGSFNGGSGNERFDRREKVGFFNSSRADEVDNWASAKSFLPRPSDGPRRERRVMGFESHSNGSGPDSGNWFRRKEEKVSDSDTWGRKEGRENVNGNGIGRPRLNLQPRTLPVVSNERGRPPSPREGTKPRGANPFGAARPREEVLAEKGKDWKEIDEKLEALKMKEVATNGGGEKGEGFSRRRGFGMGRSELGDDKTVKSWRKPNSEDGLLSSPSSAEEGAKVTLDSAETERVEEEN